MGINITKKTATTNTTASAGRAIKYIVIHYTAGVNSRSGAAVNTAGWFAQSAAQASADFIVDDENIVQYNPDPKNRYCWAVGGKSYGNKGGSLYGTAKNANSVSIEVCSTNSTGTVKNANDKSWSFSDKVVEKAVELAQYLMQLYGIDADHVIRHYDVNGKPCPGIIGWNAETGDESKWKAFKARLGASSSSTGTSTAKDSFYRVRKSWADAKSQIFAGTREGAVRACRAGYSVYDPEGKCIYTHAATGTQASDYAAMTEAQYIEAVGPLYTADEKAHGILACVSLAQSVLESGYGKTDLAQAGNNLHGMKYELSGNTWEGTSWDGSSYYEKESPEVYNGKTHMVRSKFRAYENVETSIADHAAYLLGAMNGKAKRFAGITTERDYKKAIQIIKNGGYATDPEYVTKIVNIIERWNLTRFNASDTAAATEQMIRVTCKNVQLFALKNDAYVCTGDIVPPGTYTVTAVTDGMGKLKSGAGYVSMGCVTRC